LAQETSALEEVVVTAQKREQNVQDVGVAVTAVSDAALELMGPLDHTALAKTVPSVQIFSYAPNSTIINVRGVSQTDFSDIQEAPVAFYNDEVYVAQLGAIAGQMFDLQRVEVLRGPQGTLFGRNATGGLVQVVSRRPTDSWEGYATVTGGDFGQLTVEGAVGGPLSAGARMRIAAISSTNDGYIDRLSGGDDLGNTDFAGGRGQLEFDVGEHGLLRLSAQYMRNDEERGSAVHGAVSRQDADGVGVYVRSDEDFYGTGPGRNPFGYAYPSDVFSNEADFTGVFDREYASYTARYEHDLGGVQLVSITNYQEMDKTGRNDFDASPDALVQGGVSLDYDQFSQELRLSGASERLNWVVGGYYLSINHDALSSVVADAAYFEFVLGAPPGLLFQTIDYSADQETESYALFAQGEYALNDTFTLVLGGRYSNDDKSYVFTSTTFTPAFFSQQIYDFNARRPDLADQTFDNWSGKLQLEARPNDDLLLFVGVNRGTKAGGFNAPNTFPSSDTIFDPVALEAALAAFDEGMVIDQEVLTSYEGGFKWTFASDRATLNGTLFHYDYDDYQSFQYIAANSIIRNVDAELAGAELELTARLAPNFDVTAFVTHMFDATIEDLVMPFGRVTDRDMPQSPEWSAGVMASLAVPLGDLGSLILATNWKYNSDMYLNAFNAEVDHEDAYTVGDVRVSFVTQAGNLELAVFANNITEEEYRVFVADNSFAATVEEVYGRPRWVGASLTYRFGN
jgi:iron complex outermembrane receptor protein